MCNMLRMPRRTRASGVVVWDDRDAGDATVLEGGLGDHGCFCSWFGGERESRAGKTLRAVAGYHINFQGVVNVSDQVRQSRAPGLMRLCNQDDTIGVTTTCDYVSGNVLVQHGYALCSSGHFIGPSLTIGSCRWHVAAAVPRHNKPRIVLGTRGLKK